MLSSRVLVVAAVALLAAVALTAVSASSPPLRITQLPGYSEQITDEMYTGYVDTEDGFDSQIFYWLSKARQLSTPASATPVVLWLQGGPGCSGGLGWFYENGPYNLNLDQTLSLNPYSWSSSAHFLFVDQPIGTGLSTLSPLGTNATYPTTIGQSTKQLYTALLNFLEAFPELQGNPFYITGESYGGKYIPNLATMILDTNSALPSNEQINLQGIAIGNGWVDPLTQTSIYGAQAFNLGLIDQNELSNVNAQMDNCSSLVAKEDWVNAQVVCDNVLNYIVTTAGNINVDDVREWTDDEHDNRLEVYLSNPAVARALGLVNPPSAYTSCSAPVGAALATDEMIPSVGLLPRLVQQLPIVYLYEGIFDMNCGVVGVEKYLAALFPTEYAAATKTIWYSPDDHAVSGYVKPISATLTFIVVQDSGHMVPKTQPKHSLDLITHFLTNTPFPGSKGPNSNATLEQQPSAGGSALPARKRRSAHKHHVYGRGAFPTSTRVL